MDAGKKMIPHEERTCDELLKTLECPFTWNMSCIVDFWEVVHEDICDESVSHPLIVLMNHVLCMYVTASKNGETQRISEYFDKYLENCKVHLDKFKELNEPEISYEVLNYVSQGTTCFVYQKLKMHDEMLKILTNIQNVELDSKKNKSTLLACKAICWLKNNKLTDDGAEPLIREALEESPNCHLWYFILAKTLRKNRRDLTLRSKPSREEKEMYLKAYKLSNFQQYKIQIARLHRENWENEKALVLYEDVVNNISEINDSVLLKLALGFTQMGSFEKAKLCLDKVGDKWRKKSIYMHYYGNYYMKTKKFKVNQRLETRANVINTTKNSCHFSSQIPRNLGVLSNEAKDCFEKAVEKSHNLSAERQYIQCLIKLNKKFDVTSYLSKMLHKYEHFTKHKLQPIFLDLAFCFWIKENDMNKALDYFYQALSINPQSLCLTNYSLRSLMLGSNSVQVYEKLKNDFLPRINFRRKKFSAEEIEKIDRIAEYCNEYAADTHVRTNSRKSPGHVVEVED